MPPPQSQMLKPALWWSRPSPPWLMGVRPNSPAQTMSVSSSIPCCFRSVISAMQARSTSWALKLTPSVTPPLPADARRRAQIEHRIAFAAQMHALESAGEKARGPLAGGNRLVLAALAERGHHDETRQLLRV